ncbi:unnamed protein product [Phytomonas sp. Hart1]|nr:unnamed protein product [Phytomonas sp. Hart1]|eukprot:CCW66254.1 unnamed protein product [Phytomonas sp. isolate Hart1]
MAGAVKRAMRRAPEGNPTSLHETGRAARMAMEKVRVALAEAMGLPANEIIFTGGGTESNNIALQGYRVLREEWSHSSTKGPQRMDDAIEKKNGDEETVVRVVDLVNHETGSISREFKRPPNGRLHVDASQAFLKIDFRSLDLSEVDSMTVTAHKINGPIGIAALYLRGLKCHKLYSGGSQEKGIRPGTENLPAIIGFGAALKLDRSHSQHREIEAFVGKELEALGCELNRRGETSGFIVHATLPAGYDNTEVVSLLSTKYRVEIGTGSACNSGVLNTTVYDTLGKLPEPRRSIRLSWDCYNTMEEAERVMGAFSKVLAEKKPHR